MLRRSVYRVRKFRLRIIGSGNTATCLDVEAAANRLQHCVRFGPLEI